MTTRFNHEHSEYIVNNVNDCIGKLEKSPYDHIIIDNFLPEKIFKEISTNFPESDSDIWDVFNYEQQIKKASNKISKFPSPARELFHFLNSYEFIAPLEKLLGIRKLISDPYYYGAGLHQIESGGKLNIHSDFSEMEHLKLFRRCNLIIYFNNNWKESYGGKLELWEKDMSKCVNKVTPIGNRAIIFRTDTSSFHGHPEPLKTPKGLTRKSMALYYYTIEPSNDVFGIDTRWRQTKKVEMSNVHLTRKKVASLIHKIYRFHEKISGSISTTLKKIIARIDVN